MKATNKNTISEITNKYDFRFKKDLGQNFLTDENIVLKIVDSLELTDDEVVLEVGPGMGSLTQKLAERAYKVYAVEIDTRAVNMLEETLSEYNNIEIINKDILKTDLREILEDAIKENRKIKFISNLPYYITSPILMKVLEDKVMFENIVVMLQKEVATRLNAKVNTKDYSSFTIAVDYYAEVERLFNVPKTVFVPMPKVDSTVLRVVPRKESKVDVDNQDMFFKVVKAAFMNRRKMVFNSLANGLAVNKDLLKNALLNSGLDEKVRAENITIEQFAKLSNEINNIKK
ncbi:16S rRNA (adenine(1518)-N(6)/adenine(1519)-N(6))-dimethyltransferase RsmA [Anaerofustis stercorihominis]|uniref:Ribosomal RNA small subunit methyltransferase A n=1 Tax=Anaerofustis stercorihominis DSM 17244 TaxID=445971 RepID=B1CC10_9FIRM|nr:16S rRNA (adenine(1518)-N(6)/adenine(1519)-N(6))-dimethyltransferase RsmA [Anaerofustis stercorihominis]EDS71807.1 dimethyladenosine transferase [Anaerofustis stercorihominis DSM 17244]MCQ4796139.1 16S rRNA (adenine(1518)-N(6)/adenine(1519)-N(6))-dimethyltransferase RsmA [Anaerofustis stercorihominis]